MNILKQLFLAIALVVGISITASAQTNDNKKPKKDPPVVPVENKKPKEDKPKDENKDNNKGKKPEISFYLSENRIEINLI